MKHVVPASRVPRPQNARAALAAPRAVVIGAGPAGLLAAQGLAERGWGVTVLEYRGDDRAGARRDDRAFNMTLSAVGRAALGALVADAARAGTRIDSRVFHHPGGTRTTHRYGRGPEDYLLALTRSDLVRLLRDAAEATPGARVAYGKRVVEVDIWDGIVHAIDAQTERLERYEADYIVGTDGANSVARHAMAAQGRGTTRQFYHDCTYLSVPVAAEQWARSGYAADAIHFARRRGGVEVAIPNADGTACLLMMRGRGPDRAAGAGADLAPFLSRGDNALTRLVPDLPDVIRDRRPGVFITTSSSRWVGGRLVLAGDAAHAQPAYVGQGVNAALADVAALLDCVDRTPDDVPGALDAYQQRRSAHAAGLSDFSDHHGRALLSGKFGNWRWRVGDRVERVRERLFGYRSRYQRIVFDREEFE